ncbi:MAG: CHASE3 domain-containing protein [Alphaproteobacteria bacterium]|nr:CHASE3 domain-containing protein [Alphaproteobacteria bacterium]
MSLSWFDATVKVLRHRAARPMGMQLIAAALALLCSAALLLGLNIFALHRQVIADREADKIIEQLDETANHMLAIEVAVRGYALFGNPKMMDRYRVETAQLRRAVATLDSLTAAIADLKPAMARIRRTVGLRMAIVSHAMELPPDPPIRIAMAMRKDPDHGSIDNTRSAIAAMRAQAETRRQRLATATEAKAVQSFALAGAIIFVSIVIGALGAGLALFPASGPLEPRQASTR